MCIRDRSDVNNLFLLYQERKDSELLDCIERRVGLPMKFENFIELFKYKPEPTKHKEIKIYHTSKISEPRKWGGSSYRNETKFQTPAAKLKNGIEST